MKRGTALVTLLLLISAIVISINFGLLLSFNNSKVVSEIVSYSRDNLLKTSERIDEKTLKASETINVIKEGTKKNTSSIKNENISFNDGIKVPKAESHHSRNILLNSYTDLSSLFASHSNYGNPFLVGDFSVSVSPSSRTVTQGGTATYTITIQSTGGFNSSVSLTALNLPGNQVLPGTGFSPQTVTPPTNGSTTSTLSIVTNNQTPIGNFTITIRGTSGSLIRETNITLTVNPSGDFSVSASPSSRTIAQGATTTYSVTVQSLGGFSSPVSLTALNLPGNQVLPGTGFVPQTVTPSSNGSVNSTLTIVTNNQTPTGTFTITIRGTSGGLIRNTTVSLTVTPPPDFTVSASPTSRTVTQGGTSTYTITVQSLNGFNSSVSLTALNLPGNQVLPGTGFSPQTVTPPSNGSTTSTLSIVTNNQTPTGTFTITVRGTSGSLIRETTVTLTVNQAGDFSISATPSSRTIAQGGTTTYAVNVQGTGGFSGAVSLTALNLPGNQVLPGTGFNPQTVTLAVNGSGSSTLTIVTNNQTPTGTFTITIRGTSGSLVRDTTVTLIVTPPPDFSISATPTSRTISQGNSAVYTITIQSINGFNNGVSLTALNLPGNQVLPGTGFTPQTVTPLANGSTTSTLTIITNNQTLLGNFTITVRGTSGSLVHDIPITLTVNPLGDFSVSATPISRTVAQGFSTTYNITVQSTGGFNSPVSLTALNLPGNQVLPGTGFTPQVITPPANSSANSTLTIATNNQTPTGTFTITVRGTTSSVIRDTTITLIVNPPGPPPAVSSINPSSPISGNVDQNVTVSGTNFQAGLTVTVTFPNGGTGTLSGTQIQNVTSTSFIMRITLGTSGNWSMRVNNSDGGQSNPFGFKVLSNVQAPTIFSINPSIPVVRSTDQDVFVSGNNFQQNLVVDITFPSGGGTTLSGTQIQNVTSTSFIMRATLSGAGDWTIKVRNPDGGQSSVFSFTVTNGTNPVINSINPSSPTTNGADQNVIVNGSNFQNGLKVNVTFPNGGVSTLQGTGQIQNVTANSFLMRITLNAAGSWTMRVVNPDNSQSQQFMFDVQASGPPPTGLPTSVLSPVIGSLRVTTSNQGTPDGKWEFNQHGTGFHTPTGGISLSNDRYAWDVNLYTPTSGNADAGKTVFAVADGQVVSYIGTSPGGGPGAVLIAHPNASNPVWFSGFLHMTNVRVSVNEFVTPTTVIGEIGRVGANNDHLHFVVYSGQNTRGNLQSFNVAITERSSGTTNTPVINSVNPPSTTQSDNLQLITINGSGFQPNSIIEVQTPYGQNFTITPEAVSIVEAAKIEEITSSTITARIPFAFDGNYTLTVINRPSSLVNSLSENLIFPASSSSQYYVALGPQKTPVIIIPGIMGSKIEERNGSGFNQLFPKFFESQQIKLKNHIGYGNPISERPIVATDILRTYAFKDFYGTLINTLTGPYRGYKLYNVNNPNQRTAAGCDFSLQNDNANLYIFPYDWRSGNEQSARDLRDFIVCIGQRHGGINNPNFKVNIIAHSMGGLVARRYILEGLYGTSQNYDPKVSKMVSLGTPWLGAPEIILTMEMGEKKGLNAMIDKDVLKDIIRYMQGAHELIPSRAYVNELADVNPGDFPFGEDGWDFDGRNGIRQRYNFGELEFIMNRHQVPNTDPPYTIILPGTDTDVFHNKRYLNNRPLQDDWSGDQSGVTYYNFIGRDGAFSTIGSVIAWKKPFYNPQNSTIVYRNVLEPKMQRGDGTVPEISGMRQSGMGNYLGPAIPKVFDRVNHSGLPNDSRVIQCIENVFAGLNPNSCNTNLIGVYDPENADQIVDEPVYNLSILGSPMVIISDSFGNTTNPLSTSNDEGVNTVSTTVTGEDFLNSIIPLDQNYKVTFRTSTSPLAITITRNQGDTTTLAIRYLDTAIPPNVLAQLEITPQGVTVLRYDSDGDGSFDTPVNPTISVTGTQAQDVAPPNVIVNETVQSGTSQVVLEASDAGTGVRRIMYSLNGTTFQPYSTPLTLNPSQTPTIYVFADDNVFNRSGLVTHNLTTSNVGFSVTGPSVVTSGSQVMANWNAPSGRPVDDWVGLFRVSELNSRFIGKQYTNGQTSGSLAFTAPNQPGLYEFRYLLNDGFSSVAISNTINVTNTRPTQFDFEGDGKADISIFRPSNGQWWIQRSSNGSTNAYEFGSSTDKPVPADYDGDGKTDVAFWRPSTGEWFVLRSSNLTFFAAPFGTSTDIPAPGDFDGDGKTDFTVFRPSQGTWYINKTTGGIQITPFGTNGDLPVVADYDGDGKADIAIYRPTGGSGQGEWWLLRSSQGVFATPFGSSTDRTVQGDYTGDGKADIAFWRPSTGEWFILRSEDLTYYAAPFGVNGDIPAPADYDGDGKFDLTVFRPNIATWFILNSSGGTSIQGFGAIGDIPTPSSYVR